MILEEEEEEEGLIHLRGKGKEKEANLFAHELGVADAITENGAELSIVLAGVL